MDVLAERILRGVVAAGLRDSLGHGELVDLDVDQFRLRPGRGAFEILLYDRRQQRGFRANSQTFVAAWDRLPPVWRRSVTLTVPLIVLLSACNSGSSQEDINKAVAAALASASARAESPTQRPSPSPEEADVEDDVDLTEANPGEEALDGEFGALESKRVTHQSHARLEMQNGLVYEVFVELYEPSRLADTPCAEPPRDDRAMSFPIKITFKNPATDRTLPSAPFSAFYQKVLFESPVTTPDFFNPTSAQGECGGAPVVWEIPPGVEYEHVGAFNNMLPGIATQPFYFRLDQERFELEFDQA